MRAASPPTQVGQGRFSVKPQAAQPAKPQHLSHHTRSVPAHSPQYIAGLRLLGDWLDVCCGVLNPPARAVAARGNS